MNTVLLANVVVPAFLAVAAALRRHGRDLEIAVAVFFALAAAYFGYEGLYKTSRAHGDDFNQYLVGAAELLGGRDPYADFATYKKGGGGPIPAVLARYGVAETTEISYPPPFYIAVAPLLLLPYETAFVVWSAFNAVLLVLTVILAGKALRLRRLSAFAAALAFAFVAYPTLDNLHHGQVNVVLALLLAASLWGLERKKASVAGLCGAAATLLKLYPALVLIYFVLRRRWRELAWAGALVAATVAAAAAAWGPGIWFSYARNIVFPTLAAPVLIVVNMAPVTLLPRLVAGTAAAPPMAILGKILALAGFCLLVYYLRKPRLEVAGEVALLTAAMLALNNWVVQASCVILVITYMYLGREAWAGRMPRGALVAAATGLTVLALRYGYEKRWALSWPSSWILTVKPTALLLTVAAVVWLAASRGSAAVRSET